MLKPTVPYHTILRSSSLLSLFASITRVHNAKHCQQPSEWSVLSRIKCVGHYEVVGFQVILYSLEPCDTRTCWRSFPFLWRECRQYLLAFMLSYIRATCPEREKHLDWTAEVRSDRLVLLRTSALETNWYHFIPSIFRASFLMTSQHSEPYRKVDLGAA